MKITREFIKNLETILDATETLPENAKAIFVLDAQIVLEDGEFMVAKERLYFNIASPIYSKRSKSLVVDIQHSDMLAREVERRVKEMKEANQEGEQLRDSIKQRIESGDLSER